MPQPLADPVAAQARGIVLAAEQVHQGEGSAPLRVRALERREDALDDEVPRVGGLAEALR
jgi:hypothetical protein